MWTVIGVERAAHGDAPSHILPLLLCHTFALACVEESLELHTSDPAVLHKVAWLLMAFCIVPKSPGQARCFGRLMMEVLHTQMTLARSGNGISHCNVINLTPTSLPCGFGKHDRALSGRLACRIPAQACAIGRKCRVGRHRATICTWKTASVRSPLHTDDSEMGTAGTRVPADKQSL